MDPDLDDTIIGEVRPGEQTFPPLDPHGPGARALRAEAERSAAPPPPPPVYSFRIGPEGERIALDTVIYVGRKPAHPRIPLPVAPRLITVVSRTSEVSSTHLELRQIGSSVVVTDLRSTNGSIIVIPGSSPKKLRQGESIVVTPGTLVDIGDGNRIEILSPRVVSSDPTPAPHDTIGAPS
ncbi:MAG: FHA domain-containing protein [Microbacteriaceae bacterium]